MVSPPSTPHGIVRPATGNDVALVIQNRSLMYRELGWDDEDRLERIEPLAERFLRDEFANGGCSGFVAEVGGAVVGSVVLVWQRMPPTPRNLKGVQAYILGMYVLPEHRRRGVARALMTACIECATEAGVAAVMLEASDVGRRLYEDLGFASTSQMRLFTEHADPSAWREL